MPRLVINADDFGLHPSIDEGIIAAKQHGILTSASLLVTGRNAARAVSWAKKAKLAMGLHLALSGNLPCAASPDSVRHLAPNGRLPLHWGATVRRLVLGLIPLSEIERELSAQVALAASLGAEIDHLDSHQHLHVFPQIRDVVFRLAGTLRLPLRWPPRDWRGLTALTPDRLLRVGMLQLASTTLAHVPVPTLPLVGFSVSGQLTESALVKQVSALPAADCELMCHPGYDPGLVKEDPHWRSCWTAELAALTSPSVARFFEAQQIERVTYRQLFSNLQT
jgi:predicted glycoside hydrolase/deacetylase ChbG (UPF0249 family)